MNKKAGFACLRVRRGAALPFLPLLALLAVFLPLPLVLLPVLFFISLVLHSRAAPAVNEAVPVRFLSPPSLRSPPF
ncbi:MAG: hypothetical protein ABFD80_03415 [Acidobacteriota bacterium]